MAESTTSRRTAAPAARRGRPAGRLLLGIAVLAALAAAGCSSGTPSAQGTESPVSQAAPASAQASQTGSAGGTTAAASATPTPTPAGSASSAPAGCPSAHATYASCGFPTAQTTGWRSAGMKSLKNVASPGPSGQGSSYATEIKKNGEVINGLNITGALDVYANNVTIENSRITTRNWFGINQRNGFHGLKIIHCTIIGVPGKGLDHGGEDYGISDDGNWMTVAYNDVSGFGEGLTSGEGYFHDNYVHNLQSYKPLKANYYFHTNGLIDSGGSGIKIVHNTFLNWMPPSRGGSSSLMLAYDSAPVTNAVVSDNWLAGGSYCLYPGGVTGSRNIVVTGNLFSTEYFPSCGFYGLNASTHWHYGGGDVWHGNAWANGKHAGQTVLPG